MQRQSDRQSDRHSHTHNTQYISCTMSVAAAASQARALFNVVCARGLCVCVIFSRSLYSFCALPLKAVRTTSQKHTRTHAPTKIFTAETYYFICTRLPTNVFIYAEMALSITAHICASIKSTLAQGMRRCEALFKPRTCCVSVWRWWLGGGGDDDEHSGDLRALA